MAVFRLEKPGATRGGTSWQVGDKLAGRVLSPKQAPLMLRLCTDYPHFRAFPRWRKTESNPLIKRQNPKDRRGRCAGDGNSGECDSTIYGEHPLMPRGRNRCGGSWRNKARDETHQMAGLEGPALGREGGNLGARACLDRVQRKTAGGTSAGGVHHMDRPAPGGPPERGLGRLGAQHLCP